jgi:NAD(P)-dependent dehydrogenase (short-subunit alcohol dehydrogenase family)
MGITAIEEVESVIAQLGIARIVLDAFEAAGALERHINDPEEQKEGYLSLIPLKRWGLPDDVAGATVFLASDAAAFITGQNLHINGGMTTH